MAATLLLLLLLCLTSGAHASPLGCGEAADIVERSLDIPQGLLRAIATVESDGDPLAVNVNGRALRFPNEAMASEAARVMSAPSALGARPKVDIGCFQIDLAWHPDAFANVRAGFDPVINGIAAGLFLRRLHALTGDWREAVARYHAASREGGRYALDVFRVYEGQGEPRRADGAHYGKDIAVVPQASRSHRRGWVSCLRGSGVTIFVPAKRGSGCATPAGHLRL
ncbi:transglycosylase SLT domain-containing protein [Acetobacter sacchari]|uniref:transglycosylase SLT domain-containing protein n=1 Tax=Acetobacter sacchari TaxID=2661687 RepID=UPI001FAF87FA|nr:transglycosylase SLT domain-containing protein [Acetobacter sacchari]